MDNKNFNNILKNIDKIPDFISSSNKILSTIQASGESGAGLVKVILNGKKKLLNIKIDNSLLKEDKKILENLISSAINNANDKINIEINNKISTTIKDIGLPENFISMLHFINNK